MGKAAILVPREEMLLFAHNVLQESENSMDMAVMKVIKTENAVMEARNAAAAGASIIIARGLQYLLIKQYTKIPAVPIAMTSQELALLVNRAKKISRNAVPAIALVGVRNSFSSISHFDELFGVEMREYYIDSSDAAELMRAAEAAAAGVPDVMIGGDVVINTAAAHGIPSLFMSVTEESIRNAIHMARSIDYAANLEKKSNAQIETLLDYSFNGVVWIDLSGNISSMNPLMEQLSGMSEELLKGKHISELSDEFTGDILDQVLKGGKEYSLYISFKSSSVFATIAPIVYENKIDGAVITCNKLQKKAASIASRSDRIGRGGMVLNPLTSARTEFHDILQKSEAMKECVRMARLYAVTDQPVVLTGETGTEKRILAECIHNGSRRSENPFIDVPCEGMTDDEQRIAIFEDKGAFMQCPGGTVMIRNMDELTPANQYRLYQAIYFKVLHRSDIAQLRNIDVRVMVTLRRPLRELWRERKIKSDLYYVLSGLELNVPPLRERQEDLDEQIELAVQTCNERYSRYHVLTSGARKILSEYAWPGNLVQVNSFCDRLILTASQCSIDEIAVKKLLNELYPEATMRREPAFNVYGSSYNAVRPAQNENEAAEADAGGRGLSPESSDSSAVQTFPANILLNDYVLEAGRIAECLRKNGGSRERTAAELGISKATLWRRMKKFGIEF